MRLLVNQNALELQLSFSSTKRFWNIGGGNLGQKYILQTVEQLIQLFVAAKVSFSGLLYFSTFGSEGKFPRDYLPNMAICLFAYQ